MSERPWIKHDGGPRPVAEGTVIDVKLQCGAVLLSVVCGLDAATPFGGVVRSSSANGDAWRNTGRPNNVIAYRLSEDPQAEKDRISARQDMFRKIAEEALIGDKPVKAPKKVGVE